MRKAPLEGDRGNAAHPRSGGDLGTVMQFGISLILATLAGSWLDRKFGTSPALLLAGMVVGAAAGFYSMYRKLTAQERDKAGRQRGSGDAGP
jgi:F0F1-type ATP synthase assembly protein I